MFDIIVVKCYQNNLWVSLIYLPDNCEFRSYKFIAMLQNIQERNLFMNQTECWYIS